MSIQIEEQRKQLLSALQRTRRTGERQSLLKKIWRLDKQIESKN